MCGKPKDGCGGGGEAQGQQCEGSQWGFGQRCDGGSLAALWRMDPGEGRGEGGSEFHPAQNPGSK